jgi:hypothetical protein
MVRRASLTRGVAFNYPGSAALVVYRDAAES